MRLILFFLCISLPWVLFGQSVSSSNELDFSTPTVVANAPGTMSAGAAKWLWIRAAREYETNSAPWKGEGLLMVARGYVMENNYDAAIPVYKLYLGEEPTNASAALELGKAYILDHKYDDSIAELKVAWKLGSDKALGDLAALYILLGRCSDIKPYVNDLFGVRDRFKESNDKLETTDLLLIYSLRGENSPNKTLFLKAIDGLSDQVITGHAQTDQLVIHGLETFGLDDRAKKLEAELK